MERSIRFHDPSSEWDQGHFSIYLEESRPDGSVRSTHLNIDNSDNSFALESERDGKSLQIDILGDRVKALLDGEKIEDPAEASRLRLDQAGALRTRNYYLYLYGLPMKLRDPGARIDPDVQSTDFQGRPAQQIKVSYDPAVGSDVWYFYFAPEGAELIGYRFYHDEAKGDGEYIVLQGLADVGDLRLPATRTWYTHQGDELLGTDTIVE